MLEFREKTIQQQSRRVRRIDPIVRDGRTQALAQRFEMKAKHEQIPL